VKLCHDCHEDARCNLGVFEQKEQGPPCDKCKRAVEHVINCQNMKQRGQGRWFS
jgi:hypothetical protein